MLTSKTKTYSDNNNKITVIGIQLKGLKSFFLFNAYLKTIHVLWKIF